jgi:hypothetical protein
MFEVDANGTPVIVAKIVGGTTRPRFLGDLQLNTDGSNYSALGKYQVNAVGIDAQDFTMDDGTTDSPGHIFKGGDDEQVKIYYDDSDDRICFAHSGGTFNEEFCLEMDTKTNQVVFSSSSGLTAVDFGSIWVSTNGAVVGTLYEVDDGVLAAASNNIGTYYAGGTLITNEGATTAEEYNLPAAASGYHFKASCAELFDMSFDAGTGDNIYVHDADTITAIGDGDMVTMDCAARTESMYCYTQSDDGTTWDWVCECGVGACTDGGAGT